MKHWRHSNQIVQSKTQTHRHTLSRETYYWNYAQEHEKVYPKILNEICLSTKMVWLTGSVSFSFLQSSLIKSEWLIGTFRTYPYKTLLAYAIRSIRRDIMLFIFKAYTEIQHKHTAVSMKFSHFSQNMVWMGAVDLIITTLVYISIACIAKCYPRSCNIIITATNQVLNYPVWCWWSVVKVSIRKKFWSFELWWSKLLNLHWNKQSHIESSNRMQKSFCWQISMGHWAI